MANEGETLGVVRTSGPGGAEVGSGSGGGADVGVLPVLTAVQVSPAEELGVAR